MFKQFSLRAKLVLAFMLMAVLVGVVSVYQVHSVNNFSAAFNDIIENDFARKGQLEDIRFYAIEMERRVSVVLGKIGAGRPVDAAAEQKALRQLYEEIAYSKQQYLNFLHEDGGTHKADIEAIGKQAEKLRDLSLTAVTIPRGSAATQIETRLAAVETQRAALVQTVERRIDTETHDIQQENASGDAATVEITGINIILAAATAGIALVLGLLMAGLLGRAVGRVRNGADRIANGDFSRPIEVTSNDEIGRLAQSFNGMAERLRDSYTRLALGRQRDEILLESMSDGLIAINEQGEISLVNSKAAEMLDIGVRTTLMGKRLDDELVVYTKDDKPLPQGYYPARQALEGGLAISEPYTYHKQDGRKIIINITMSPVVLEGKSNGVIMVIRDVTKEMQIDRMKTEFISLASHQLRTPLSAIKWFSEMLLSGDAGELTPEQKEFAKNVSDSTERMIQLVNSLLNISRIESGRIIVDPKPTDLKELVSGIVNDLKAKIEERQQNLAVSVHDGLPKVNLDARLIGQVYLNLLTNAIKYTPKGGDISVFVSRKDDMLVSQVTDNGYGIPKAEHGKMFQKFFRAENVAKVETDGTGLGLYLIKAIVESSGGKIWFESEEGKGSTFWFSLPMSGMKAKEGEVTLDV